MLPVARELFARVPGMTSALAGVTTNRAAISPVQGRTRQCPATEGHPAQRGETTSTTVDFGTYSQTFVLTSGDITSGVVINQAVTVTGGSRSEERRVGKEC